MANRTVTHFGEFFTEFAPWGAWLENVGFGSARFSIAHLPFPDVSVKSDVDRVVGKLPIPRLQNALSVENAKRAVATFDQMIAQAAKHVPLDHTRVRRLTKCAMR